MYRSLLRAGRRWGVSAEVHGLPVLAEVNRVCLLTQPAIPLVITSSDTFFQQTPHRTVCPPTASLLVKRACQMYAAAIRDGNIDETRAMDDGFALLRCLNNKAEALRKIPESTNSNIRSDDITVSVEAKHLGADFSHHHYSYTITITNDADADTTWQLLSRKWNILDSENKTHTVAGDGVIGKQPILAPGQQHTYESGVPLATSLGRMDGYFVMQDIETKRLFEAIVAPFRLDANGPQASPFEKEEQEEDKEEGEEGEQQLKP